MRVTSPAVEPTRPVRIVHLGLGNFFRAHQAWYTEHASDAPAWGIAAFTGRSPAMAEALRPQGGRYTLITRGASGDSFEVISSVVALHAASEHEAFLDYLASPSVAVVTLTVTEAGYPRASDGGLDAQRDDVASDLATLRADLRSPVTTTPGRLVAGLAARRASGAGPIAIVSCDNLSHNGEILGRLVREFASLVDDGLAAWIDANVAFGTTMVDRITPATTDEHRGAVLAATGLVDEQPVPTEPFSEWVIQGEFPAGRPDWESAGARIVDDVVPFEKRKLALLNGAHSLMAYAASILGHETVADAMNDARVRGWVEQWWDEASAHLPLPTEEVLAYRAALTDRFLNPNIRHALAQIAADGSQKIPVRFLPTLRAELEAGRLPAGVCRALGAWVLHLRGTGAPIKDVRASELTGVAEGDLGDGVRTALEFLDAELAADDRVVGEVVRQASDLAALASE